ncbi:hypothetical protein [Methylotenera sp.]|uniref:hypothetical protein n=1 Tax=Methylotenera sp. TaxID=2051956 RepID=UPI0027256AC6|nr:hypothetical protein [Methylotenera sp.]MDO9205319.1 hypothetical protein [Methylotenera sp.]MDO9393415.1 hypothetical protein [Methylotenera sp.]MDP1522614.1 hypothetical protein [Methylotenera sp.]MDP2071744.1 hypothetical protein [Methylotenera sp.]MDP2231468.1 hypothetical protein [Methylotenera sp.]
MKKGWKLTKKTKNSVGWIHPSAQVSLEFSDLDDKPKSFFAVAKHNNTLECFAYIFLAEEASIAISFKTNLSNECEIAV